MILDIILSPEVKFSHNSKFIEVMSKCLLIDDINKKDCDILKELGVDLRPFIKQNKLFYFLRLESNIQFYSNHINFILKKIIQDYNITKNKKNPIILNLTYKNKEHHVY